MTNRIFVGIDLAGKEHNPTGFALWHQDVQVRELYKDEELLGELQNLTNAIVAVDAPFTFPKSGYWRDCDRKLIEKGFKPLSPKFPNMQVLVKRAQRLIKNTKRINPTVEFIETYPPAVAELLFIRKDELEKRFGQRLSEHEFDAVVCCIMAKMYAEGEVLGLGSEDKIYIPKV
jgi:predicted nuclease with RNAse H fold